MKHIRVYKLTAVILLSAFFFSVSVPFTVSAENEKRNLPFELTPPENISLAWLGGEDTPTTMECTYAPDESLASFISASDDDKNKLTKEKGIFDIDIRAQIDWSLDSENSWHYNKYWDGSDSGKPGYDASGNYRLGIWDEINAPADAAGLNDALVMRGNVIPSPDNKSSFYNDWWTGNSYIPGLKKQLGDVKYELVNMPGNELAPYIDYKEHTAYVRVRWCVTAKTDSYETRLFFSDWSETACYGKLANEWKPLTSETLKKPEIDGLEMLGDQGDNKSYAYFELTVPQNVTDTLGPIRSYNGDIELITEVRLNGCEEWVASDRINNITTGRHKVGLDVLKQNGKPIPEGSLIELRCRYRCIQYSSATGELISDFETDDSDILECEAKSTPFSVISENGASEPAARHGSCSICGSCPAPLGICIYIWIILSLIFAALIVFSFIERKK